MTECFDSETPRYQRDIGIAALMAVAAFHLWWFAPTDSALIWTAVFVGLGIASVLLVYELARVSGSLCVWVGHDHPTPEYAPPGFDFSCRRCGREPADFAVEVKEYENEG